MSDFTFKAVPNDELDKPVEKEPEEKAPAAPAVNPLTSTVSTLQAQNAALQQKIADADAAIAASATAAQVAQEAQGKELVDSLDEQIKVAAGRKAYLSSEGKYQEAEDLGIKLTDMQGRKQQLESVMKSAPAAEAQPAPAQPAPAQQAPAAPAVSQAATDYVAKNQWYMTDKNLATTAQMVDKQISSEGKLQHSDPAYFTELNRRLKTIHPDAAAQFVDTVAAEVKPKKKGVPTESTGFPEQRVEGITHKKGEFQVSLTPGEVATCVRMNVSQQDYAQEKLKMAKDRGEIE